MTARLRQVLVPAFLLLCILLGGSPHGVWRSLVLQLLATGMLAWLLFARAEAAQGGFAKALIGLALIWFGLLLLQLVPLPPALWTHLPGRDVVVEGFALRGEPLPRMPWSLAPAETLSTLPVMLVPLAILVAATTSAVPPPRWCSLALLAGAMLSILLGALQLAQGRPYLYPIYNEGVATGLFANANHQGTLLLTAIPFLALLTPPRGSKRKHKAVAGQAMILGGGLLLLFIGILLSRSLAAMLLCLPVSLASWLLIRPPAPERQRQIVAASLALVGIALAAAILWSSVGAGDNSLTSRADIYRLTLGAIRDSMPFGSGVGSFPSVYHLYEDPAQVTRWFVNHAHSDPLEWLLEAGLPGFLLLLAFGWVWARQAVSLWRASPPDLAARAGTIASAAILAHSLVDYPVRDAAIQAVMAVSLALMAQPRMLVQRRKESRAPRHLGIEG